MKIYEISKYTSKYMLYGYHVYGGMYCIRNPFSIPSGQDPVQTSIRLDMNCQRFSVWCVDKYPKSRKLENSKTKLRFSQQKHRASKNTFCDAGRINPVLDQTCLWPGTIRCSACFPCILSTFFVISAIVHVLGSAGTGPEPI